MYFYLENGPKIPIAGVVVCILSSVGLILLCSFFGLRLPRGKEFVLSKYGILIG